MYEAQMILTRGFQNVYKDGQPVGFQFLLKTAYYRGTFLDLVGAIDVSVDGKAYSREQLRIGVKGRVFTMEEAKSRFWSVLAHTGRSQPPILGMCLPISGL
jgi:hypothetical protein